ncbi:unnamed protein product [Vitrella brassicaformis CCMP3155]|uniref:Uncharacterized protein n=1 Tax=Vitrella brassicaformis (strain CCMP3155) TaxID=1169540 RepID=A0A0G4EBR2_VITBC|nr:unnamed protein product [Vitrella brassicaformis CCMP3155]|eukprot:CEL92737.1 unnamed protein product [Vitrella brassicaformis CCMP3155]
MERERCHDAHHRARVMSGIFQSSESELGKKNGFTGPQLWLIFLPRRFSCVTTGSAALPVREPFPFFPAACSPPWRASDLSRDKPQFSDLVSSAPTGRKEAVIRGPTYVRTPTTERSDGYLGILVWVSLSHQGSEAEGFTGRPLDG